MEEEKVLLSADEEQIEQQQESVNPMLNVPKKKWKRISIIIAALLLVVCIGTAFVLNMLSPESVSEQFVEAVLYHDVCKIQKYLAYDYCNYIESKYDIEEYFERKSDYLTEDITSWEELSKAYRSYWDETYSDKYGKYEFSIEATRVKDISNRKLEEKQKNLLDTLEDKQLIDRDDITEVKEVTLKVKITGDDETDRDTITIYLVKIGAFWKVLYDLYDVTFQFIF